MLQASQKFKCRLAQKKKNGGVKMLSSVSFVRKMLCFTPFKPKQNVKLCLFLFYTDFHGERRIRIESTGNLKIRRFYQKKCDFFVLWDAFLYQKMICLSIGTSRARGTSGNTREPRITRELYLASVNGNIAILNTCLFL